MRIPKDKQAYTQARRSQRKGEAPPRTRESTNPRVLRKPLPQKLSRPEGKGFSSRPGSSEVATSPPNESPHSARKARPRPQTIAIIRSTRLVKVPSGPGNRVEAHNRGCQFGLSCHVFPGKLAQSRFSRSDLPLRQFPSSGLACPVTNSQWSQNPLNGKADALLGFEPRSEVPGHSSRLRRFDFRDARHDRGPPFQQRLGSLSDSPRCGPEKSRSPTRVCPPPPPRRSARSPP